MYKRDQVLATLSGSIIVSCQPVVGGPMDNVEIVKSMGLAAEDGHAGGLRIEGVESVRALHNVTDLPIIGIVKRELAESPVIITPWLGDVENLVAAGATIVAYDATQRSRPVPTKDIVQRIRELGAVAMADCARVDDGRQALEEGAHILGTTLSGYAYDTAPGETEPDWQLLQKFSEMGAFVIAEGRIKTPDQAAEAVSHGADAVVVGSAITRVEHITSWFATTILEASNKE